MELICMLFYVFFSLSNEINVLTQFFLLLYFLHAMPCDVMEAFGMS